MDLRELTTEDSLEDYLDMASVRDFKKDIQYTVSKAKAEARAAVAKKLKHSKGDSK